MSTYNQGAPSNPLVLSASNISAFGNAATGNALTVQQLGAGPVVSFSNVAGQSFVMNANGQVGIGTTSTTTQSGFVTSKMCISAESTGNGAPQLTLVGAVVTNIDISEYNNET